VRGWLLKSSMGTNTWKQEFVVLDPALKLLVFYSDEQGSTPNSIMDLSRARLMSGGHYRYGDTTLHTFLLCGVKGKTPDITNATILGTKDAKNMQEWQVS
jgi:hypothetical protein